MRRAGHFRAVDPVPFLQGLVPFMEAMLGQPAPDSKASPARCIAAFARPTRGQLCFSLNSAHSRVRRGAKGVGGVSWGADSLLPRLWRGPRSCCHPSGLLGGTGDKIVTIIEKNVAHFCFKNSYLR